MRLALDRWSAGLVGWVPDLSRITARRQAVLGAGISLLVHLIILLFLIGATIIFPERPERPAVAPVPEPQLTVQIMPPKPQKEITPAFEEKMQMLDARGMEASEKPKDAQFESDRDMVSRSEKTGAGDLPIPTQDGRTDRSTPDFANQDVKLKLSEKPMTAADDAAKPVEATSPTLNPPPTEAMTAPPVAPPTNLYEPHPVSKEELAKSQQAPPDRVLPEPARQTRATPPPLEKVAAPRPDQLAMMRPAEITQPGPITRLERPATPAPAAPLATPPLRPDLTQVSPQRLISIPKASSRYQERLEKTKIDGGNLSNKGPAGVAAIATPAGRWWAQAKGAIGQNWYLLNDLNRESMSPGSVRVSFAVDGQGKLHDLRVEAISGPRSLEEICLRAVRETRFSSPPAEMVEPARDQKLEYTITFNYF